MALIDLANPTRFRALIDSVLTDAWLKAGVAPRPVTLNAAKLLGELGKARRVSFVSPSKICTNFSARPKLFPKRS